MSDQLDELVPPVVTAKPTRGREMQTTTVPTDVFESMKVISAKKTLHDDMATELEKPREAAAEYYHEGYVDGKLFLVPDSNLEAMKDIINFKMRPRRSTRYKHQTSYEISDYDHFRGKLDKLLYKIDIVQSPSESQLTGSETPSSIKNQEASEPDETSEYETYEEEEELKPIKAEESESGSTESELEKSQSIENKPTEIQSTKSDIYRLRFLISGHFKKDKKPIYIIQEYNGEPNIFKDQKADFFSKQKDGNVDVNVSGKFYSENLLEERDGKPVALKTRPDKIIILKEKSKIYSDYFKDTYKMKYVDITLKGEFLKNKGTNKSTPYITLGVKKRSKHQESPISSVLSTYNKENIYTKNTQPTTVLISEPKSYNPFSQDLESDITNESIHNSYDNILHSTSTEINETSSNILSQTHLTSEPAPTNYFSSTDIRGEETHTPLAELYHSPYQPSSMIQNPLNFEKLAEAPATPNTNIEDSVKQSKTQGEGLLKNIKGMSVYTSIFGKKNAEETSVRSEKATIKKSKKSKNEKSTKKSLTPERKPSAIANKKSYTSKNKNIFFSKTIKN